MTRTRPLLLALALTVVTMVGGLPGASPALAQSDEAQTNVTSGSETSSEAPSKLGLSVTAATTVGIGTFVEGPQKRELVVGSLTPAISYKLADTVVLSGAMGLTWYALENAAVGFEPNRVLLGSASVAISDGKIWSDADKGLTLSGKFGMVAPTSLGDQLTNKLFSMAPSMALHWKVGDISLSGGVALTKHFNRTNQATLDCSSFSDEAECRQGRLLADSLSSESSDGEVVLTGTGLTSFSVAYNLALGYAPMDGLGISLGVGLAHAWGVVNMGDDELSSVNATTGRAQSDALTSSFSVSYQAHKHLGIGLSLATATARPLGAQGDDIVLFDFTRASDNITTLGLSLTGSM